MLDENTQRYIDQQVSRAIEARLGIVGDMFAVDRIIFDRTLKMLDGRNIQFGGQIGTKIGTEADEKIGFFGATPVIQQTYPTTAEGIADMLETLGFCGSGTFSGGGQTIYAGHIDGSDGSTISLPTGWSAVRDGTGAYTVTHNLGLGENGYVVVASMRDTTSGYAVVEDISNNDFEVEVYDNSGSANDEDFTFIMVV